MDYYNSDNNNESLGSNPVPPTPNDNNSTSEPIDIAGDQQTAEPTIDVGQTNTDYSSQGYPGSTSSEPYPGTENQENTQTGYSGGYGSSYSDTSSGSYTSPGSTSGYNTQQTTGTTPPPYNSTSGQGQPGYGPGQYNYQNNQPGSGQPGGGNPYPAPNYYEKPPQNTMATASLVMGILSFLFLCCPVLSIIVGALGIIFGFLSKKGAPMNAFAKWGVGLSIAGLVIGIGLTVVGLVSFFTEFIYEMQYYDSYYY